MSKFKVGDKVKVRTDLVALAKYGDLTFWGGDMEKIRGKTFTVSDLTDSGNYCFTETGYVLSEAMLMPVSGQKIVITTDGKTTMAAMYDGKKKVKTAKAVCAESDDFDFNYGASLALDRLTAPEHFTGKVRCTHIANEIEASWLTEGKIYQFVDGVGIDDDGDEFLPCPIKSVACLNDICDSTFEEIKDFDWDSFKAGNFNVVTNRENIDKFLKECDEHDIKYDDSTKATQFNPIDNYDERTNLEKEFAKALLGFDSTEECAFEVSRGYLKYNFSPDFKDTTVTYD